MFMNAMDSDEEYSDSDDSQVLYHSENTPEVDSNCKYSFM